MQAVMRDRWLNTGYLGEELKPYVGPSHEISSERVGKECECKFLFVYNTDQSLQLIFFDRIVMPGTEHK